MFEKILKAVKNKTPLVHSITNYVTVNDCANIILACGGAPIMSDDISEVEEITSICDSLVINIGTLNERTIDSMIKAGKKANELGHPVILDPVGAGASKLRTDTVFKILDEVKVSVIRGNISEIKSIYQGSGKTKGVDADLTDVVNDNNLEEAVTFAKNLSKKTGAVIAISGAIDIVADKDKAYIIRNGHPIMAKITGTGCMLSEVTGVFCGANKDEILDASAAAACVMGICGERALGKMEEVSGGTATFKTHLIDQMSKFELEALEEGIKIERR